MKEDFVEVIRENYDRLAAEYTAHISNELQHKPLDCELLRRFAEQTRDGEVCDLGCGPGHVARFLRQAHAKAFGLNLLRGRSVANRVCETDFGSFILISLPLARGVL